MTHGDPIMLIRPLILMALTVALLGGCSDDASPAIAPNVTAQQQAIASQSTGLSFPPQTQFLLYHRASDARGLIPSPDDAVHLKIELPAAALAGFLDQPPLSSADWTSNIHPIADLPKWPGWRPSGISKFRFDQFQLPKGQCLDVLIDDDREDTKVLYVIWFET